MSAKKPTRWAPAKCLSLALLVAGCGGGAPSGQSPTSKASEILAVQAPGPVVKPVPTVLPKEPEPGPPLPPLAYDAKGRRDPFVPVSLAKDKAGGLSVTAVKLVGVIKGRALLALVEAPDGLGYILKPGDVLGDGRVTDVTQNSVTFAIAGKAGQAATTVTLRLAADQ
jgi:Tfp pilus assembly protein PilP